MNHRQLVNMTLSALVIPLGICSHYKDAQLASPYAQCDHLPNMLVLLFKFASYVFLAFAGGAFLVILRHRFRQQQLWKIPGPSSPSLIWGTIRVSVTIRTRC